MQTKTYIPRPGAKIHLTINHEHVALVLQKRRELGAGESVRKAA
jgi:hypothetical protein